jgi:hypothetical protein
MFWLFFCKVKFKKSSDKPSHIVLCFIETALPKGAGTLVDWQRRWSITKPSAVHLRIELAVGTAGSCYGNLSSEGWWPASSACTTCRISSQQVPSLAPVNCLSCSSLSMDIWNYQQLVSQTSTSSQRPKILHPLATWNVTQCLVWSTWFSSALAVPCDALPGTFPSVVYTSVLANYWLVLVLLIVFPQIISFPSLKTLNDCSSLAVASPAPLLPPVCSLPFPLCISCL